jgi:hypothetical protein
MADLSVQKIDQIGISPTFSNADPLGDSFPNDGKTYYHVKNDGATSITATINSIETCNFGFDHDLTFSVASSGEKIIGPFQTKRFNNENARVGVSYSDVTAVSVAAFRL